MHAIRIREHGGPEVLEQVTEPDPPHPGPGQVLVEVAVAGVNFVDTYQRRGLYDIPLPSGLGLEGAGTVMAVGDGVTARAAGHRVAWDRAQGSYATHVLVDADATVLVPDDLDLQLAGSVMLQGMTAHFLTHSTRRLGSDDTALVFAAAGGVGRLLVQLAKRRGARVLACTSTEEKAADVRDLGADEVILYRDEDVAARVRELTGGVGADVVYDSIGHDTFEVSLASVRPRGLVAVFGQASGPVPPMDIQALARAGSVFLTRPRLKNHTETPSELNWRAHALFDLIRSGQLDVRIHGSYPLSEAAQAHRDLESGTTSGKLRLLP